jgi:hypothetical protein
MNDQRYEHDKGAKGPVDREPGEGPCTRKAPWRAPVVRTIPAYGTALDGGLDSDGFLSENMPTLGAISACR